MSDDLTQAQARELFDYDSENGILIRKFKSGKTKPCGHKPVCNGYGRVYFEGKEYYTHRIIWLWWYGSLPEIIDHIDQNKINNRIENLRSVTKSENEHNRGLQSNSSSGYPGVSWHKCYNKYASYIKANNKQIHLGLFTAPEEAYLAYQLAKISHHPSSPIAQEYLRELTLAG